MTRIICDAELRKKLHDLAEPVELCDESGRILARVWPALDPTLYTQLEPQISDDELNRHMSCKGKTYTSAKVVAYLESL